MPSGLQLRRQGDDVIQVRYEDQHPDPNIGGMAKQELGQLTLSRATWQKLVRQIQWMLENPEIHADDIIF